jgi:hypothetical protein
MLVCIDVCMCVANLINMERLVLIGLERLAFALRIVVVQ